MSYFISVDFNIMLLPLRQTEGKTFRPYVDITEIVSNTLKFIFICASAYKLLSHEIWFELQK